MKTPELAPDAQTGPGARKCSMQASADRRKAVGYVRVSTDQQADRGVSLDAQAEKIRAMATVQEAELVDVIVDGGESGKSLQRPGIERLLAMVDRREIQVVVIAKLDRLTRSVRDLGELLERFQRRGVALVSVSESLDTGSAAGRLVLNVMASVSQWEREAIGERTRDALRHKRAQGLRAGNVPFGFSLAEDGQTLLACREEQEVLSAIRDLRRNHRSLRSIAGELNARGLRTRSGAAWRHEYVANLLRSASAVM
jgi:site-specific DNA recombinase